MSRYEGLDLALRAAVVARDLDRCRWCTGGHTVGQCAAHHVTYRRGEVDDRIDNLILLCYACHSLVHDSSRIPKQLAQRVLYALMEMPGTSGRELYRRMRRSDITDDRLNNSALARRRRARDGR